MACGHVVELGSAGRTAALMRILRGTKPAGTAAAGRRQYFYIALLWDNEWLYATIPNISNTFDDEDGTVLWEDKPEWTAIESRLENFEPKSFSAAIKAASAFTKKESESSGGLIYALRSHPHRPRRRPALVAPSSQTNICRMASLV